MNETSSEIYRRRYLLEMARRLASADGERLAARALRLIARWEADVGVSSHYISGWRRAIESGPQAIAAIAEGTTEADAELRHCMPFAGILTNAERKALRMVASSDAA
jgi:hypothetical protein